MFLVETVPPVAVTEFLGLEMGPVVLSALNLHSND